MSGVIGGPGPEDEDEFPEPPRLRALRLSVMGLMGVMALGIAVIAVTIAMKLGSVSTPALPAPVTFQALSLPEGFAVQAMGTDGPRLLVMGRDASGAELLLSFDKATGEELSRLPVERR